MNRFILTSAALMIAAPAFAQDQPAPPAAGDAVTSPGVARAVFLNTKGDSIGTATLTETPNGVLIRADITDLPAGPHGFHIHQTGACDPEGGFESAGGHFNPDDSQHGFMVEEGPHAGDMANQTVAADGKLIVELVNEKVAFEGDASLFDDDGSAIVIHATADDHRSQPSGAAGDRIACGVIEQE